MLTFFLFCVYFACFIIFTRLRVLPSGADFLGDRCKWGRMSWGESISFVSLLQRSKPALSSQTREKLHTESWLEPLSPRHPTTKSRLKTTAGPRPQCLARDNRDTWSAFQWSPFPSHRITERAVLQYFVPFVCFPAWLKTDLLDGSGCFLHLLSVVI